MNPRPLLPLLLALLLASSAAAESFAGSVAFGTTPDLQGTLHFTALDPGETASGQAAFAGYSQTASSDYTYLYRLDNASTVGAPTSFCNEHCFIGLDLETLFDPNNGDITSIGSDASNGGEPVSFSGADTAFSVVFYEFDASPNFGIEPSGGFSAFLRFTSPLAPTNLGGAFVTNNAGAGDFVHITSGITTPVPEPASASLLALGLLALVAGRRARGLR